MAIELDKIIVIDVESTCWEEVPPDQKSEIIEIGICVLDTKTLTLEDSESMLVRPANSTVSDFCTELTTLTQEMVDGGVQFANACAALESKYKTRFRAWASWGDYDRRQFKRQCEATNTTYPFGLTHINVKNLFAVLMGLPKEVGMAKALEMLDMPLVGIHHRGVDDARNIANIMSHIFSHINVEVGSK